MKIAILSDIHDHIWNLEKVLKELSMTNIEAVIYCGDFRIRVTTSIVLSRVLPPAP